MDSNLLQTLRRENPWLERPEVWPANIARHLPEVYIPRRLPDIAAVTGVAKSRQKALLVVGPRQAGKSTWIWKQLESFPPRVLVVNCEIQRLRDWCSDPGALLADLSGLITDPALVFLEEVQHLDDAALFIKGLVDRGLPCPLVVTGSSSFHLRSRTRESLAGRARRLRLLPLSLDEVCGDIADQAPTLRNAVRRERLERQAVVGGYPAVWHAANAGEELASLVEAFVLRDASDLHRIERPDAFRSIFMLAARQVGSAVNLSEWASIAGVSVPTVASYLSIMEEAHLVVRVPVHVGGKRAELTLTPKLYFVDCGLRNRLVSNMAPLAERADDGPLLENWVFAELYKVLPLTTSIAWWRTKSGAEVDLVVRGGERLVAIEVKVARRGRASLSRGARSFIEAYAPQRFFVATLGVEHEETIAGCGVEWLHAADVADRVKAVLGI